MLVVKSIQNGVATLALNSPENLNALNPEMLEALYEALEACEKDDEVKVIVISGNGKGFSGGGDIGSMIQGVKSGDFDMVPAMNQVKATALKIRSVMKPIIASMHGPVAGAGVNLALLCDFRIAADNAKFVQAFVNIGLIPDMGGTYSLVRMIGGAKANELVMMGSLISAEEALGLGLLNKVVAMEDLEIATLKLATSLSKKPALALAGIKELMNQQVFDGLEKALEVETHKQAACTKTEDFVEGITAFVEKRQPNFIGR